MSGKKIEQRIAKAERELAEAAAKHAELVAAKMCGDVEKFGRKIDKLVDQYSAI